MQHYAADNHVSQSPIEGGIEITGGQYQAGRAAILDPAKAVSIEGGQFAVIDKPKPVTYWLAVDDERKTEPGEDVPSGATTEPPPSRFHDLVDGEWVEDVDAVEADCLRRIDAAASHARSRFISEGVGQEAVYLTKYDEALAYKAASSPTDTDYPYLNAEAQRRGVTVDALAGEVIATRNAWTDPVGATIEAERVGGKKDVRDAADADAKRAACDAAIATLDGVRP